MPNNHRSGSSSINANFLENSAYFPRLDEGGYASSLVRFEIIREFSISTEEENERSHEN